jgi:hypothetical protein
VSLGAPKPGGDLGCLGRGLGRGPGCLEPNLSERVARGRRMSSGVGEVYEGADHGLVAQLGTTQPDYGVSAGPDRLDDLAVVSAVLVT